MDLQAPRRWLRAAQDLQIIFQDPTPAQLKHAGRVADLEPMLIHGIAAAPRAT